MSIINGISTRIFWVSSSSVTHLHTTFIMVKGFHNRSVLMLQLYIVTIPCSLFLLTQARSRSNSHSWVWNIASLYKLTTYKTHPPWSWRWRHCSRKTSATQSMSVWCVHLWTGSIYISLLYCYLPLIWTWGHASVEQHHRKLCRYTACDCTLSKF